MVTEEAMDARIHDRWFLTLVVHQLDAINNSVQKCLLQIPGEDEITRREAVQGEKRTQTNTEGPRVVMVGKRIFLDESLSNIVDPGPMVALDNQRQGSHQCMVGISSDKTTIWKRDCGVYGGRAGNGVCGRNIGPFSDYDAAAAAIIGDRKDNSDE
ncbi:Hypothetical predicted protein [Octopus vulgaris]|uniref:Uncharacterized protein n=1 Tax=Octopus vulgaris TaxID=6645 RepID=A0AA36F9F9_OCTVU|nr:Hypothetical predicted protein [Octopus vulgaris]